MTEETPILPMKTCHLHLGFHKTATTSFQNTCQKNKSILANHGIHWPDFLDSKGEIVSNHTQVIHDIYESIPKQTYKSIKRRKKTPIRSTTTDKNALIWFQLLENEGSILISGEGILKMSLNSIKRFIEDIQNYGFKIHPFACTRPPYAYINSALQQTIKNGKFHSIVSLGVKPKTAINSCTESETRIPNSLALIKKSKKFFGSSMTFYTFSMATTYKEGPVAFMIKEALGIPFQSFELEVSNESLCNLTTRLINCLNSTPPERTKLELRRIRKIVDQNINSDKFLLTEEEFNSIKTGYEKIKTEIMQTLGEPHIIETIKFSQPLNAQDINKTLDHCPPSFKKCIMSSEQYQALA